MIPSDQSLKTVSFFTLGCRLNQSETAVIERTFERDGFQIVDYKQPADFCIINTCTVTENGDADTRRVVNKMARLNPSTKIALIGCQAQTQKEKLMDLPNVQWIVGNAKKMDIAAIVAELDKEDEPRVIAPAITREAFTVPMAGIDERHTRANLKIQDGCDFFCSFCEIPYARGRARSREFDDILKEARILADAGHQELVLTGINIATYQYQNKTIVDVVEALEGIKNLRRIRISSIEPTTIPDLLIDKMAGKSKLCKYLHIPLQSGHKDVLKKMKRLYTADDFFAFIRDVYARVEDICIGTDVIVGFPGETEAMFEETRWRLANEPIHYFHVFSYSERYLAKSKSLSDAVPVQEIQRRSKILRELSARKRKAFYESQLYRDVDVLWEQKKKENWIGLTDNYIRVAKKSSENLENTITRIQLSQLADDCILSN